MVEVSTVPISIANVGRVGAYAATVNVISRVGESSVTGDLTPTLGALTSQVVSNILRGVRVPHVPASAIGEYAGSTVPPMRE